jgi:hypothetical protein
MPTNRIPRQRARTAKITDAILQKYLALRELVSLELPPDDPRMMAWGEHDTLRYELHRHFGLRPWHAPEKFQEDGNMLAEAAGVTRLHPDGCYELT